MPREHIQLGPRWSQTDYTHHMENTSPHLTEIVMRVMRKPASQEVRRQHLRRIAVTWNVSEGFVLNLANM